MAARIDRVLDAAMRLPGLRRYPLSYISADDVRRYTDLLLLNLAGERAQSQS